MVSARRRPRSAMWFASYRLGRARASHRQSGESRSLRRAELESIFKIARRLACDFRIRGGSARRRRHHSRARARVADTALDADVNGASVVVVFATLNADWCRLSELNPQPSVSKAGPHAIISIPYGDRDLLSKC